MRNLVRAQFANLNFRQIFKTTENKTQFLFEGNTILEHQFFVSHQSAEQQWAGEACDRLGMEKPGCTSGSEMWEAPVMNEQMEWLEKMGPD